MYWQVVEIAEEALTGNHRHRAEAADRQVRMVTPTGARVGSAEHERRCAVCRGAINTGDGRYRINETEYHPDCFKFWLIVPWPRGDNGPM